MRLGALFFLITFLSAAPSFGDAFEETPGSYFLIETILSIPQDKKFAENGKDSNAHNEPEVSEDEKVDELLKAVDYEKPMEIIRARKIVSKSLKEKKKKTEQQLDEENPEKRSYGKYSRSIDAWIKRTE